MVVVVGVGKKIVMWWGELSGACGGVVGEGGCGEGGLMGGSGSKREERSTGKF